MGLRPCPVVPQPSAGFLSDGLRLPEASSAEQGGQAPPPRPKHPRSSRDAFSAMQTEAQRRRALCLRAHSTGGAPDKVSVAPLRVPGAVCSQGEGGASRLGGRAAGIGWKVTLALRPSSPSQVGIGGSEMAGSPWVLCGLFGDTPYSRCDQMCSAPFPAHPSPETQDHPTRAVLEGPNQTRVLANSRQQAETHVPPPFQPRSESRPRLRMGLRFPSCEQSSYPHSQLLSEANRRGCRRGLIKPFGDRPQIVPLYGEGGL